MADQPTCENEAQFNQLRGEALNALARFEQALKLKAEHLGVSAAALSIGEKLKKIGGHADRFKKPRAIEDLLRRGGMINDWRRDIIHSETCIATHPDGSVHFVIKNVSGTHPAFLISAKEIREKISEAKNLAKLFNDQALKASEPAPTPPVATNAKA